MKRVLLADDERASSEIIRYFIQKHQLPLEVVGETVRGDETLAAIRRLHPDIVFLDIEMPVMNGLQVMDAARKEDMSGVSFIIITAYDSFEYIQKALRLEAKDFLLKPILYEQFCETMQRVLGYRYSDNPLFNQLADFISRHYTEDISIGDCAKVLNVSESNVSKLLRKNLDTSFTAYINQLRMKRAKELLLAGHAIKDASALAGYSNLHYFYRLFKKTEGVTPRAFVHRSKTDEKGPISSPAQCAPGPGCTRC